MKKLMIFLLIGFILTLILLAGISQAEEEKGEEKGSKEGYKLTPEDKRIQIISILILVILVIALWGVVRGIPKAFGTNAFPPKGAGGKGAKVTVEAGYRYPLQKEMRSEVTNFLTKG